MMTDERMGRGQKSLEPQSKFAGSLKKKCLRGSVIYGVGIVRRAYLHITYTQERNTVNIYIMSAIKNRPLYIELI